MSLSFVEPLRSSSRSRQQSRSRSASRAMRSPKSEEHSERDSADKSPKFTSRVGFDTFDNKDAIDFSLTLQSKFTGYRYSRLSRTFLCGTDTNEYSDFALEWLMDELVEDGDELVCLRVVDPSSKISSSDTALQEKLYREEAHKQLGEIMDKNDEDKKISLIFEFAVGKVQDMIQRMIEIYEPAVLIVGTRGKSLNGFQGLLPGSISKYCLQHSPVPVIVVRSSEKRQKKKLKRQADPNRRGYMDIVEGSKYASVRKFDDGSGSLSQIPSRETFESTDSSSSSIATSTSELSNLQRVKTAPEASLRNEILQSSSASSSADTLGEGKNAAEAAISAATGAIAELDLASANADSTPSPIVTPTTTPAITISSAQLPITPQPVQTPTSPIPAIVISGDENTDEVSKRHPDDDSGR
ncbi:uncharacterized protein V1516DRAFT_712352 [Lipomyces oligophaga]|uniref:uncharacterized protein n=1 Tax=Lipomyces oligophaga TaxID=45792 RepID=UPI0034D01B03